MKYGEVGERVDASAVLPDGTTFSGVSELRELLVQKRKMEFVSTLVEQLLTYAIGRGLEPFFEVVLHRRGHNLDRAKEHLTR